MTWTGEPPSDNAFEVTSAKPADATRDVARGRTLQRRHHADVITIALRSDVDDPQHVGIHLADRREGGVRDDLAEGRVRWSRRRSPPDGSGAVVPGGNTGRCTPRSAAVGHPNPAGVSRLRRLFAAPPENPKDQREDEGNR